MAVDLTVRRLSNTDPAFYPLLGPFLARREVVKEIGGPVWDEDDKTWFVALVHGEVAGFCAALDDGKRVAFGSDYVVPKYRDKGVYRALFEARWGQYADRPARGVCRATVRDMYAQYGFAAVRDRGSFTEMTREPQAGAQVVEVPGVDRQPVRAPIVGGSIVGDAAAVFERLGDLGDDERIDAVNEVRLALREYSPMRREPVDCVLWVEASRLQANDYNPNVVAPPEMRLLQLSIMQDGFTQPIVTWPVGDGFEVVDGFHRNRVGREVGAVRKRVRGRLPISVINQERASKEDRVAATIRHNRARGVHQVDAMSAIVLDLARRNRSDEWIAKELGMEPDEVLRLKQVTAMAELFADREFSEAWEAS